MRKECKGFELRIKKILGKNEKELNLELKGLSEKLKDLHQKLLNLILESSNTELNR